MNDNQQVDRPAQGLQARYESLDETLKASSFDGSAAQAHGMASGFSCRNLQADQVNQATAHLNFSDDAAFSTLESLMEASLRDLNQAEFIFDLLLPEDAPLSTQLEALADWSQGYIIGLMYDGDAFMAQLNAELQESIQDIVAISALDSNVSQDEGDDTDFVEIREYLRMATQLIFEEMNPDRPLDSAEI